jgi:hypothetical protein
MSQFGVDNGPIWAILLHRKRRSKTMRFLAVNSDGMVIGDHFSDSPPFGVHDEPVDWYVIADTLEIGTAIQPISGIPYALKLAKEG